MSSPAPFWESQGFEVKQTRRPSGHQATNNGLSLHLVAFSVSVFSFR